MDFELIGTILVIVGLAAYAVFHFVRDARQERINDTLPVKAVMARVKSNNPIRLRARPDKRCFITFETEKGDMEFAVSRQKYAALYMNLLKTGDTGNLSYQGTRYIGFVKEP